MYRFKSLIAFWLGILVAFSLFLMHSYYYEEPEIQAVEDDYPVIEGDFPISEPAVFAGAIEVGQPKIEVTPTLQSADIEVVGKSELTNLGEFRITYYCNCEQCCGRWAEYHTTSTGTTPTENHTVAVDPDIIPLGTVLEINGELYTAEDTGAFQGRIIDIYVPDHNKGYELAAKYGDYAEVYMKEDM